MDKGRDNYPCDSLNSLLMDIINTETIEEVLYRASLRTVTPHSSDILAQLKKLWLKKLALLKNRGIDPDTHVEISAKTRIRKDIPVSRLIEQVQPISTVQGCIGRPWARMEKPIAPNNSLRSRLYAIIMVRWNYCRVVNVIYIYILGIFQY